MFRSCSKHLKTCKSIENRKSKIFANPRKLKGMKRKETCGKRQQRNRHWSKCKYFNFKNWSNKRSKKDLNYYMACFPNFIVKKYTFLPSIFIEKCIWLNMFLIPYHSSKHWHCCVYFFLERKVGCRTKSNCHTRDLGL